MNKQKRMIQGAALLALTAALLLLGSWVYFSGQKAAREEALARDPQLLEHLAFFGVSIPGGQGRQVVRTWLDESGDGWLFLPTGADPQALKARVEDGFTVRIDGKRVRNESTVSLAPGSYELTMPEYGLQKTLHVLHGGGVDALFLQTRTGGLAYVHEEKGNAVDGQAVLLRADGTTGYAGQFSALRGRGNVTWEQREKKGYQLKLKQEAPLCGMDPARRWVLVSNTFDSSGVRNAVQTHLAQEAGMAYVPEYAFVDLYVDGEYRGLYQLYEKIEPGPGRVEIADLERLNEEANPELEDLAAAEHGYLDELEEPMDKSKGYKLPNLPEDSTGGYLLELDLDWRYDNNERCGFVTRRGQHVVVKKPGCADLRQVDAIRRLYQSVEDAAFSPDGIDPETGLPLSELIDLHSFAQKYLIEEISKNLDAPHTSQFFYKPQDSVSTRLFAGPLWDYDRALGVEWEAADWTYQHLYQLGEPEGLYASELLTPANPWYALYRQPAFYEEMTRCYREEFVPVLAKLAGGGVTALGEVIDPSMGMDAVRWQTWPEAGTPEQRTQCHMGEVQVIQDFLAQRTRWLSTQWQ